MYDSAAVAKPSPSRSRPARVVDPAFPVRAAHHGHGLLDIIALGRPGLDLADLGNALVVEKKGLGAVRLADRLEDGGVRGAGVGVRAPGRGHRVDQVVQPAAESLLDEVGDLVLHRVGERVAVEEDQIPPRGAGDVGGGGGAVPAGSSGTPFGGGLLEGDHDAADAGALESGESGRQAVSGRGADDQSHRAGILRHAGRVGAACHMSATSRSQPAGWESRKRKPRLRGG